mmetsp:Transcript_7440/g.30241  ORF Transcript_7440/g.30241 Transcript_7440/m.30241 type:complete len:290 (-) Transcript_7440:151-1020(-)
MRRVASTRRLWLLDRRRHVSLCSLSRPIRRTKLRVDHGQKKTVELLVRSTALVHHRPFRAVSPRSTIGVFRRPVVVEYKVGDRVYVVHMYGLPVRFPHLVCQFVSIEPSVERANVQPSLLGGFEDRGALAGGLPLREVALAQRTHELLLLALARGPQKRALALHWLPLGVHIVVQRRPCLLSKRAHLRLDCVASARVAADVRQKALVPRAGFQPHLGARRRVGDEAVRPSAHVDGQVHIGALLSQPLEGVLDVELPDVSVWSLCACHKIADQPHLRGAAVCGRGRARAR